MYLRFRLAMLMKEKDLSEAKLHEMTKGADGKGVARNTIRALMRNANRRVDFEVIERIADALGVRPMDLFEETEKAPGQRVPVLRVPVVA